MATAGLTVKTVLWKVEGTELAIRAFCLKYGLTFIEFTQLSSGIIKREREYIIRGDEKKILALQAGLEFVLRRSVPLKWKD